MNITEVCIRRPVLAWMIMAATILFGLVSATRIGISQMPDVDSPNVTVSLSWPGAAPEEVEHGIIEPLECIGGRPVLTSNQSMVWHLLRSSHIFESVGGFGQLFDGSKTEAVPA